MAKGKERRQPGQGYRTIGSLFTYDSKLSLAPGNATRPMDVESLHDVIPMVGARKFFPAIGIPHYIQCNLVFEQFESLDSFKLALSQLFRDVRIQLKSNLPYLEESFRRLIAASVACYAKAKAIEKCIKYYTIQRADIKALNKFMQMVTDSITDSGLVEANQIAVFKDPIEDILLAYDKMREQLKMLYLPNKLKNLIDYFLDTPFVDNGHVNFQIYDFVLRSVPKYGGNATRSAVVYSGTWDIKIGSIGDIEREAADIADIYGVQLADIAKTGLFVQAEVSYLTKDNLNNHVMREDKRIFTYLINNYRATNSNQVMSRNVADPYMRIDLLEATDDHLLMATLALAHWAGFKSPFDVISMAIFYTAQQGLSLLPHNVLGYGTGISIWNAEAAANDFAVYQTDGVFVSNQEFDYSTSATTQTFVAALDNLITEGTYPTVSSATISPIDACELNVVYPWTAGKVCKLLVLNTSAYGSQYAIWARYKSTGTSNMSVEIVFGTFTQFDSDRIDTNPDSGTVIDTYTTSTPNGATFTLTNVRGGIDFSYNIQFPYSVTMSVPSGIESDVVNYIYGRANNQYDGVNLIWNVAFAVTTVSGSTQYAVANKHLPMRYMDDVEFHLPVLLTGRARLFINGVQTINVNDTDQLYKQDYIPVLVDKSNINASLYWGCLGLFDMVGSHNKVRQAGGQGRNHSSRPQKYDKESK